MAMQEIDMDSSPGLCQFRTLGSVNKDVFQYREGVCDPERVSMVRTVVYHRLGELIQGKHSVDPINVFIKPEPHKNAKIEEGRLRLISAVSLVDTLVDRILFGWLQRRALCVVGRTPCLCGWTPLKGGWRFLEARFSGTPVMCLDKSSWDWTVQPYMVDLWQAFIVEMGPGAAPWWLKAVQVRFDLLFRSSTFQFNDGTQVEQKYPGIMKSGCLLTLILNSVGQSMLHYLANIRMGYQPTVGQPITVGDDTVQRSHFEVERYVAEIAKLGAKVKGFKVQNWIEFCGFAVEKGTCVPAYWQKHLFKMQYGNINDWLLSYQFIYANEPLMFEFLRRVALELGPQHVISIQQAKAVLNGTFYEEEA